MNENIIDQVRQKLNNDVSQVVTMLNFLIIQPNILTSMIESNKEKIMIDNLIRIKSANLWSGVMIKEIESRCKKETIDGVNDLIACLEIEKI